MKIRFATASFCVRAYRLRRLKERQTLQSSLFYDAVVMLGIICLRSSTAHYPFAVFRKNVAGFVEILRGVVGLVNRQIIDVVFRIFIKGIYTVIHGMEYMGQFGQCIKVVKTVDPHEIDRKL